MLGKSPDQWPTIIPEGKDVIEGRLAGRRQALCSSPARRKARTDRLHARRQGDRAHRVPRHRRRHRPLRPGRREGRLLHLPIDHRAADDLPLRHRARGKSEVFAQPKCPSIPRVRDEGGLLHIEGRNARADVHRRQKGTETRRLRAPADDRIRRLRAVRNAGLEPRVCLVDATRRMVRPARPARRQRVRRGLAQGGHVREEAECLRRLVCRRRVPDP